MEVSTNLIVNVRIKNMDIKIFSFLFFLLGFLLIAITIPPKYERILLDFDLIRAVIVICFCCCFEVMLTAGCGQNRTRWMQGNAIATIFVQWKL